MKAAKKLHSEKHSPTTGNPATTADPTRAKLYSIHDDNTSPPSVPLEAHVTEVRSNHQQEFRTSVRCLSTASSMSDFSLSPLLGKKKSVLQQELLPRNAERRALFEDFSPDVAFMRIVDGHRFRGGLIPADIPPACATRYRRATNVDETDGTTATQDVPLMHTHVPGRYKFNDGEIAVGRMRGQSAVSMLSLTAVATPRTRFAAPASYEFESFGAWAKSIRALSCSHDGVSAVVAVNGDKHLFVVDVHSRATHFHIEGEEPPRCVAMAWDGKFALFGSANGANFVDCTNGKKGKMVHLLSRVAFCAFSDDGEVLMTSSAEDGVILWDVRTAECVTALKGTEHLIHAIAFSRRGGLIAASAGEELKLYERKTGDIIATFPRPSAPIHSMVFSNDGERILTCDSQELRVYDTFTGQCLLSRFAKQVHFSPKFDNMSASLSSTNSSFKYAPKGAAASSTLFTTATFVAGNGIFIGTNSRNALILDPCTGEELLSLSLRASCTASCLSYSGEKMLIGDASGNVYTLSLKFSDAARAAFMMKEMPKMRDKGVKD